MRTLADVLARLLQERGMTQAEFAEKVGLSQPAISLALAGKMAPHWRRAGEWAEALGLGPEDADRLELAMALAATPPRARRLIDELEAEVARLSRRG